MDTSQPPCHTLSHISNQPLKYDITLSETPRPLPPTAIHHLSIMEMGPCAMIMA